MEHTPKPFPTGCKGIPFIAGWGDCLGCALGVCCNFLGNMAVCVFFKFAQGMSGFMQGLFMFYSCSSFTGVEPRMNVNVIEGNYSSSNGES